MKLSGKGIKKRRGVEDLLPEVPPRQKHHEVRPRNLTETLRIILVEESAPPFSDLINSQRTFSKDF